MVRVMVQLLSVLVTLAGVSGFLMRREAARQRRELAALRREPMEGDGSEVTSAFLRLCDSAHAASGRIFLMED